MGQCKLYPYKTVNLTNLFYFLQMWYRIIEYSDWKYFPGGQQRDSAIYIHVSMILQTPLPSSLPHNTEQSSLCYAMGPYWLSVLNIAVCIWLFHLLAFMPPTPLYHHCAHLFLFLGPPCSLRYNNIETRPCNNLPWPLSIQMKGRVTYLSLLNLKLHRIKLTEEGKLKAKTGQKQGLLQQWAKLWMPKSGQSPNSLKFCNTWEKLESCIRKVWS